MAEYVLPMAVPQATADLVGTKGANLIRLTRAGFPVPPGFLITTAAYDSFVRANNLYPQVIELASPTLEAGEGVSKSISQRFAQASFPPAIAAEIGKAYQMLGETKDGPVRVAVRSSATTEDLPGASFAGQHETYLNVRGIAAVLEAVKQCWSSLWTARALQYRARHGIDPATVNMAVVVQWMVPATAAGIMFTSNAITGDQDEVMIDVVWGPGQVIASGLMTPDHVVADKRTGAIKQRVISDKAMMTVLTATGTDEGAVEMSRRRAPVLNATRVAHLVRLGKAIETEFGAPQDIEWCLADDQFYVVQCRPITTLPPAPVHWVSPIAGAKWMADVQAAEWAKEPLSPLGATSTFATMVAAREQARTWPPAPKHRAPWFTLINGWLYLRADHDPLSIRAFIVGLGVCLVLGNLDGHKRVKRTWPPRLATLDSIGRVELAVLSDTALQAHFDRLLHALAWWWIEVVWFAAVGRTSAQVLRHLMARDVEDSTVLFRGNDSLLLDAERTLRRAAQDPDQIEDYFTCYGHAVESADPIHPTLREPPEHVAWQLEAARRSDVDPDERLARMQRERARAEAAVRAMRGLRGYVARNTLATGQSHAAHTDDAVFHMQRVLAALRAVFLEAGRRLTHAGKLNHVEDVFYLDRDELWVALSQTVHLAPEITERRRMREQRKRLAPPLFIPPSPDPSWAKDPLVKMMSPPLRAAMFERGVREREGKRVLVGSPSSPGCARGIARVVSGPEDFGRFHKGDVLVAHATTPIWMPLFAIASAAVTEVGGPFAHAAIVAREFGIPLVEGALDATRVIVDGTPVVVNGSTGIVEL